jgi:hypothetical protein
MSNRATAGQCRTIHPRAIAALGERICIVMLGVARDLRSGAIAPEEFNMGTLCGTARCICGHMELRLSDDDVGKLRKTWVGRNYGLTNLFDGGSPSDPQLAARAIERYVYEGADDPWGV